MHCPPIRSGQVTSFIALSIDRTFRVLWVFRIVHFCFIGFCCCLLLTTLFLLVSFSLLPSFFLSPSIPDQLQCTQGSLSLSVSKPAALLGSVARCALHQPFTSCEQSLPLPLQMLLCSTSRRPLHGRGPAPHALHLSRARLCIFMPSGSRLVATPGSCRSKCTSPPEKGLSGRSPQQLPKAGNTPRATPAQHE